MALRNGGQWPSVTEVLELCGFVDLSMIPSSVLNEAKERGQEVHHWTAERDHGRLMGVEPPERIRGYVRGYEDFRAETGFQPTAIEEPVRDPTHMFDGTVDRVGLMHGSRCVLDLKCVYAIHWTTALQTAGYAHCVGGPIGRYSLQLGPRSGDRRLRQYKDRQDYHDFLAAVRIAHLKLSHKGDLPWLVP